MARRLMAAAIAGTALLFSATSAAAAPVNPAQVATVPAAEQAGTSPEGRSASTWIVALLALLAVTGGIVAAASSGDSKPESP